MAKAGRVVKAILLDIMALGSEADLPAPEVDDAIFAMNNFMTALDADGVNLGYTVVDSVTDTITIPDGALMGLVKNVAVIMGPQFGAIIPPELFAQARKYLKTMTNLGLNLQPMQFPDTLPIGSGNEYDDFNLQHFYPGLDDTILTETNNNILVEDATP